MSRPVLYTAVANTSIIDTRVASHAKDIKGTGRSDNLKTLCKRCMCVTQRGSIHLLAVFPWPPNRRPSISIPLAPPLPDLKTSPVAAISPILCLTADETLSIRPLRPVSIGASSGLSLQLANSSEASIADDKPNMIAQNHF